MMTPRQRAICQVAALGAVFLVLWLFFPAALAFVELAAREVRYLWWLILLVALGCWFIWGVKRKPK